VVPRYARPHFDLTLASYASDGSLRKLQLRNLDASDLYGPRLAERLAAVLRESGPMGVSAALFAWGDATHIALQRID
jgi:hypothetical protein